MIAYETPRVTFVGADPKLPALRKAIERTARFAGRLSQITLMLCHEQKKAGFSKHDRKCIPCRYVALWQARNRRTRVLMARVMHANAAR